MSDNAPPPPPSIPVPVTARPSVGRIIGSLSFIVGWAAFHYVLFFLLAGGGLVLEAMLSGVKTFLFPGRSFHDQTLDITPWSIPLTAGVVIAGVAGFPACLAILLRHKRKVMMRTFWIAMFVGIAVELYALVRFVGSIFSE